MLGKKFVGSILLLSFLAFSPLAFANNNDIQVHKLPNGHTVIIKEQHNNPIVCIDTWVKTGSINENDENNGVSHFLEHLLFKGTKRFKAGDFDKMLESKGAVFNAATSKDFTHYYITIASPYLETAVDLQADMLLNSVIPEDELKKERKVVIEEIRRAKDRPSRVLFKNLNNLLFKKHPYKYQTLGTAEIVANIPKEEIIKYYRKWYVPSNMVTIVIGDVDSKKVLSLIKDNFKLAKSQKYSKTYQREPFITKKQEKIQKGKYNIAYLDIGFKGVDIKNDKDNMALDLAAEILGGNRSSRLYQNVKEKRNLVTTISSGHYSLKDDSIFYIMSTFEPNKLELIKKQVSKELKNLRDNLVTDEELARAKTQFQRSFLYNNESVQNIATSIGYCMTLDGNLDCYTKYIEGINKITKQDIQRAVQKYLKEDKMAISVLLPETAGNGIKTETHKNLSKSILPNGMTLITGKSAGNDIISLSLLVRGGKFVQTIPGIQNIIKSTLLKGTKNRSFEEITQELEDKGIRISPALASDYFEINLKSTKQDFDQAFDILCDILNNPLFKESDIKKAQKNIKQGILASRDRPLSVAFEKFKKAMFPKHPYGYNGEDVEKNIDKINRNDVVKFYNSYFTPENMIVSVYGDVNSKDITEKLVAYFPKKQGEKVLVSDYQSEFKPLKKNKVIFTQKDTMAAKIVMGWKAQGIRNEKDYATLQLIDSLLGNGMSSRLFVNLREKQGLAYAVSSVYPLRLDNGFFALYIGTAEKNTNKAIKGFLNEIEKLKTVPVSEEELKKEKQKIIGQMALAKETNQQQAHTLGLYELTGKGYKFEEKYKKLLESVSADDIIKTANKYFKSPYIISVVSKNNLIDRQFKEGL